MRVYFFINLSCKSTCTLLQKLTTTLRSRLFTLAAGLSTDSFNPFTADDYFFWIPWLLPHVGGVVGAGVYQLMVGLHHDHDDI